MSSELAISYNRADQQSTAARLGMWIFLATEVLFFGGLFTGYIVYRGLYPETFAIGSDKLGIWSGALMTAILLAGSLLIAIADTRMEEDSDVSPRFVVMLLAATAFLGVCFLALEFHEYYKLIHEGHFPGESFELSAFADAPYGGRGVEMFFTLFFFMTGLHAIHMVIGISSVLVVAAMIYRSGHRLSNKNVLTSVGLYWHFVDIIWVFLYPLFYLVG